MSKAKVSRARRAAQRPRRGYAATRDRWLRLAIPGDATRIDIGIGAPFYLCHPRSLHVRRELLRRLRAMEERT